MDVTSELIEMSASFMLDSYLRFSYCMRPLNYALFEFIFVLVREILDVVGSFWLF
jgi:hypothetical protein